MRIVPTEFWSVLKLVTCDVLDTRVLVEIFQQICRSFVAILDWGMGGCGEGRGGGWTKNAPGGVATRSDRQNRQPHVGALETKN